MKFGVFDVDDIFTCLFDGGDVSSTDIFDFSKHNDRSPRISFWFTTLVDNKLWFD